MTVYIYKLSIFRLQPIKKVNVYVNLKNYLLRQGDRGQEDLDKLSWLFDSDSKKLHKLLDMKFTINDKMHICVRIRMRKTPPDEYDINGNLVADPMESLRRKGDIPEFHQVYYYESCLFNLISGNEYAHYQEVCESSRMQSALVTDTHDGFDFLINRKYFFIWNDSYMKYHPLDEGIDDEEKFTTADFEMDADD